MLANAPESTTHVIFQLTSGSEGEGGARRLEHGAGARGRGRAGAVRTLPSTSQTYNAILDTNFTQVQNRRRLFPRLSGTSPGDASNIERQDRGGHHGAGGQARHNKRGDDRAQG